MRDDTDFPFLTIDEAAKLLRVNRRTLDNLRWKQTGPPYRRHGGRVLYHRDELLKWSERFRRALYPA
ncbi:MAG: DNA-binding protein [Hyphomicrobiales bacterium]|nr:MAG: DNA-binding protein [Hyphomicrobiales bacterium]